MEWMWWLLKAFAPRISISLSPYQPCISQYDEGSEVIFWWRSLKASNLCIPGRDLMKEGVPVTSWQTGSLREQGREGHSAVSRLPRRCDRQPHHLRPTRKLWDHVCGEIHISVDWVRAKLDIRVMRHIWISSPLHHPLDLVNVHNDIFGRLE